MCVKDSFLLSVNKISKRRPSSPRNLYLCAQHECSNVRFIQKPNVKQRNWLKLKHPLHSKTTYQYIAQWQHTHPKTQK